MTPDERTLTIFEELDDMLDLYSTKPTKSLENKIVCSLKFINMNLSKNVVDEFLGTNYFKHTVVIKGLLGEKAFDPGRYN